MIDLEKNFSPLQITKNIISNYALFFIGILISLWYTPFLIRNLGKELFGFIPLANSVTNLLGIVTLALHTSNRRHIMVELEKGNLNQANQIYSASFLGTLVLISVAIPLSILLVILSPDLFHAPQNFQGDVLFLFLGMVIAFFLTTLEITFSIASFARNRFDLRNFISLAARISQIAMIVTLFTLDDPKLLYVAGGVSLTALLTFLGDIYLWKKLLPELEINLRRFEKKYLRLLMGTSVWMFVYQVGAILFLNLDMLVANRILGLSLAGMYGALLVIPKNIRIMSNAVGGVWGPTILSKYGKADFAGMDRIVLVSSKIIGLTLALPIGFLSGLAKPFLNVWLGPEFEAMSWVLILMIFHLSFNLIVSPFLNVQLSLEKVKLPALVSIFSGLAFGVMSIFLARKFGPMGIVIAGGLMQTIRNLLFMPIYTAKIMGLAWWRYIWIMLAGILWTVGVAFASYLINLFMPVTSLFSLLLVGSIISFGYVLTIFLLGLTKEERELAKKLLRSLGEDTISEPDSV